MHAPYLDQQEKIDLFRDGYVVITNAIPRSLTSLARDISNDSLKSNGFHDFKDPRGSALYNESILPALMREAMGPHTLPDRAFLAYTKPGLTDAVGRRKVDESRIQPQPHVDGGWSGPCPLTISEIESKGEDLHTGGSSGDPRSMGPAGGAPLWQDPDRRLSIGSFTAFVGVCLNDQTVPGKGQLAVRRGAHEVVEDYFRMQRAHGGPVGGGGPGWPRLQAVGDNHAHAGAMPEGLVSQYPNRPFLMDGWHWPELTPVLMDEGDAVITLHSLPHTATPNLSDEARLNVYFRIRRYRPGNPHEGNPRVGWGLSDHPDRAMNGDFLDYPEDYDPYRISIEKLCDHWSEWDGMQEIVARERC